MEGIERQISEWRGRLAAGGKLGEERLTELETHLRDSMDDLKKRGLDDDEAFLVAARRVGNLDELAGEFAKAGSEGEWRRLALDGEGARQRKVDVAAAVAFAVLSGLLAKLPELNKLDPSRDIDMMVWFRNAALFCLPGAALSLAYFRQRRIRQPDEQPGWESKWAFALCATTIALAVYLNLMPWAADSHTAVLTGIHLPFCLWLTLLPLYAGSPWRRAAEGMDFVRFTGESFIYGVLLGCGVVVLSGFTILIFSSAGIDIEDGVFNWVLLPGIFAVPAAALRLALAKRSVVETIAPVLARIFGPLFLAAMLAFIIAAAATGRNPFAGRDALIAFDVSLAIVFALVLYSTAMRDPSAAPGLGDWVDLALAVSALILDVMLLAAMAGRLGTWGVTPNRLAALGENLILLVELSGGAVLIAAYLFRKKSYAAVFRWQTAFIPVIFVWCGIVALAFPLVFGGK